MKNKRNSNKRLNRFILLILLVVVFFSYINRYLFYQKTIALLTKVDVIWLGYTHQKVVALTFDDGPDPAYTPAILEILRKYHTPATFFVEGYNVVKYPELIKAEKNTGNVVGNHTFTHPRLSKLSKAAIASEITKTDDQIKRITGETPRLFRPPYEELSANILAVSHVLHKKIIMSSITVENAGAKTPQNKADRVLKMIFPGAIILAHDGRLNRTATIKALPILIEGLRAQGYQIVPLKILIQQKP